MKRCIQRRLAAVVLVAGLVMLVWGGHGFLGDQQPEVRVSAADEEGLRMCPLTIRDMAAELGVGLVVRKLLCMGGAGVGLITSVGAFLWLRAGKNPV